jgi:hypothetical protein|tara:strand:- start:7816 stop:9042 length:1227 start_codon:yes stop_codon:yes gene_type:complete
MLKKRLITCKLFIILTSLFEQISASAGSLVFYLLLARLLGPSDFGLFALYLMPAQILHSIAVQWVLLPITTTPGQRLPIRLLTSVAKRMLIMIVATPPFVALYAEISPIKELGAIFLLLVTGIFSAMILFDFTRYLAIRFGKASLQATCNTIRWLVSVIILISVSHLTMPNHLLALTALFLGILVSLLISVGPVFKEFWSDVQSQTHIMENYKKPDSNVLLSFGLANAVFAIISSSALARSSLTAFGAIQTFRSLVNWAPLVLQYIETHFASKLARESKTTFMDIKWSFFFLATFLLGEAVILIFGDWLLTVIVGADFVPYLWLFSTMYGLVLLQSYTRAVSIEVRLSGAMQVIWLQVILLIFGAFVIGIGMIFNESVMSTLVIVLVLVMTAILQAISITLGLKLYKK